MLFGTDVIMADIICFKMNDDDRFFAVMRGKFGPLPTW